jgi:threonine dehydratase
MLLSEEEIQRGVATHSSGNHAAALALAAKIRNTKSYIIMPSNTSDVKKEAVAGYGANITFCEPTLEARETTLQKVVDETGAIFIHPYNNYNIICGQGTAAIEFLQDVSYLDILITPVGGGGLLSGTSIAVKGFKSNVKVFGAEPEMANDAFQSFNAKKFIPQINPQTIADGLRTSLGSITFKAISTHVDDIITAKEESIILAMKTIWERLKIIIEPSSAVPLAAIIDNKERFKNKRVGIIFSGGNVDLKKLPF